MPQCAVESLAAGFAGSAVTGAGGSTGLGDDMVASKLSVFGFVFEAVALDGFVATALAPYFAVPTDLAV